MFYLAVVVPLLCVLNPFWADKIKAIAVSQSLIRLRRLPFSFFDFPRWQSVLSMSLIGLLVSVSPSMRAAKPWWLSLVTALASVWVAFLIIVVVLRWWMRRGGRWDGQGSLFNLLAVSWLVIDVFILGLIALSVSPLITLPLWLYSIWVSANALSGAIPRASLTYSVGGVVVSLVPAIVLLGSVLVLANKLADKMVLSASLFSLLINHF